MTNKLRIAVFGAGSFGRNHVRVLSQMPDVELAAVVDIDRDKAQQLASEYGTSGYAEIEQVSGAIDAAVVATPTVHHERVAEGLLASGVDVLIEKPIADSAEAGERLTALANGDGRILQVGHLERFNPAVEAAEAALTVPLFFEVHRLSVYTPRSLDVDVVLDLMIHDLDIVLSFVGEMPQEIRAAGISVLSQRVDIANVRLAFASGCIANLTASRVSTEQVRKLRVFQPGEYISVDYQRQDATRLRLLRNTRTTGTGSSAPPEGQASSFAEWRRAAVPCALLRNELNSRQAIENKGIDSSFNDRAGFVPSFLAAPGFVPQIGFEQLPVSAAEPLARELAAFVQAVRTRSKPRVGGEEATKALRVADEILARIKEHAHRVSETIQRRSGN